MDDIKQMAKTVAQCIKGDTKKTKGYDTAATVKRVDGGTLYVSIPGGVPETPVKKTIDAKVGDTVQVHVGNGTAWLTGNRTAPPTDDAEALVAKAVAKVADQNATKAQATADEAQETADKIRQHFWTDDDGAHITEVTQEEYEADPETAGGNLLARSDGMAIREGTKELATVTKDGFDATSYDTQGDSIEIAHLGYGNCNSGGSTVDAPYYTLGTRKKATAEYSSSQAYAYGDLCIYGSSEYVCIEEITTPEAWNPAHWYHSIGERSSAQGENVIACETNSRASGLRTIAAGHQSTADGNRTIARGPSSHSEGYHCEANDFYSHAEGRNTKANAEATHCQNTGTVANYQDQTAIGRWNENKSGNLFEIGNGMADNVRRNAFEVSETGNVTAAGGITAGGHPSGLLAENVVLADNKTISGNNYGNGSASVSKTGYTPIGIVGMQLENATSSGTLNTYCMLHSFYLSGTTAYWIVRNFNSSAAKIKVTATILYVKL